MYNLSIDHRHHIKRKLRLPNFKETRPLPLEIIKYFGYSESFDLDNMAEVKNISKILESVGKFDYITSIDVIQHILNPENILYLIRKHLSDNGIPFIGTFERDLSRGSASIKLGSVKTEHIREWNHTEFCKFIASEGFIIEEIKITSQALYPSKNDKNFRVQTLKCRVKNMVKIELGASKRKMPGWISIDISHDVDIYCNLETDNLPFENESVDEIYSSHFLEHFYHKDLVEHILPECLRVLKPGGIFNVAVPDASIYINAYLNRQSCPEVIPFYKRAYFFDSFIDSINYIAYMGGVHKHLFDRENLVALLNNNGFINAKIRDFDTHIDLETRKPQSIYAIAHKP